MVRKNFFLVHFRRKESWFRVAEAYRVRLRLCRFLKRLGLGLRLGERRGEMEKSTDTLSSQENDLNLLVLFFLALPPFSNSAADLLDEWQSVQAYLIFFF